MSRLIDADALIDELQKDEAKFDKEAEDCRKNSRNYTDCYMQAMSSRADGIRDAIIEVYDVPTIESSWTSVLAELHERFDALEKEIRKASAEMSAIIREYVDGQKDEPQTIIGERFPSYITENNAQVLDGWQANPRTSTTAVEDEPQTEREVE